MKFLVKDIELYLSEVGDGDPDLQFTPQEENTNVFTYLCTPS